MVERFKTTKNYSTVQQSEARSTIQLKISEKFFEKHSIKKR